MISYTCYNQYGSVIKQLYQWGSGIEIVVSGIIPSNGAEVFFHFCNRRSKTAMVVKPTLSDAKYSSPIPNELLMMPDGITMYVVEVVNSNIRSTRASVKIPMIPRAMPEDFEYTPTTAVLRNANGLANINGTLYLTGDGVPFGDGVRI